MAPAPNPEQTLRIMLRAHRLVIAQLERLFEAAQAPTLAEAVVLTCLKASPQQRSGMLELAENLQLSRSGVSRLIDRMERNTYVERVESPADRRVIYVVLTETGRDALDHWRRVYRAGYSGVFYDALTAAEVEQLTGLLQRLADSIAPAAYPPDDTDDTAAAAQSPAEQGAGARTRA